MSLARSDVGEVLVTHASRQRLSDRQQQRLGRSPSPYRLQFEAIGVAIRTPCYAAEHFITLKKRVEGLQFAHRLWRERPPHMLAHEASEPLA